MVLTPVLIPTLNRSEHLKQCVESLLQNPEASDTELFVSVDYPPAEKYVEGYEKIRQYVPTITGFRDVHIYYQDHNIGPALNQFFLMDEIKKGFDSCIYIDDDIQFSKNSLAYFNWGMKTFKDDPNIYSVCGQADYALPVTGDYVRSHAFCPFGAGYWFDKWQACADWLNDENILALLRNKQDTDRLFSISQKAYSYLIGDLLREVPDMRGRTDNITIIDIWEGIYCAVNDKYNILPRLPKTKNHGYDGSGVHEFDASAMNSLFDEGDSWPLNPQHTEQDDEIAAKAFAEFAKRKFKKQVRDRFALFAWRHFGDRGFETVKNILTKNAKKERDVFYG